MKSTAWLLALAFSAGGIQITQAAGESPGAQTAPKASVQNAYRPAEGFFAYYTRLQSGEAFERYARVAEDADVVVNVGGAGGRLVFWRGSSYLPYWETAQGKWPLEPIVPRQGDGTATMPDRVNIYSHAELIEQTASKVVVHWRYLSHFTPGNPHGGLDPNNFVEEVFTLTPNGRITRVIKQGTKTIDEWKDPLNQITQTLQLGQGGITQLSRQEPGHSAPPLPVQGNPEKGPVVAAPRVWFRFDEGQGATTQEKVSQCSLAVPGHKALWKRGISGTALQFDGYHTAVSLPAAQGPRLQGGDLTLEGWFALGAYPWNWAPLVQQGDNDGYFLGVDAHGYPGFMLKVNGVWQQLSVPSRPPYNDANHLALFRWYHLAGTYQKADGTMRLYVDGKEVASKPAGSGGVQTVAADIRVGKAGIPRTPTEGTHDTLPSNFGLDALIDEVRIYDAGLSADQVAESYKNFNPGPGTISAPDMQRRAFPNPNTGGQFKALYTHLPYYETWENLWRFGDYADVVVGFDQQPTKFVFWRGVSYIPMMVNETNQWFNNEFNETGGTATAPGDCEPMSDKGCWDSHVRVLENSPARVVVHWRYRLSNPDHHWANYDAATGWGDIADWYYYIYPDGVAVKRMRCYSSELNVWHEWDEQIAVLSEGQHPESVLRKTPVMTLVDEKGEAFAYDWNPAPPSPAYRDKIIQMIHLTGQYSPFTVQRFTGGDVYSGERTWYSVFPSWNHWPTAQANSSGRNACFADRAAHSSISHLQWAFSARQRGEVPYDEKLLMEGMTDQSPASRVGLAKSWLEAPPLETLADCRSPGYDASQRAYVLSATGPAPSVRLNASAEHPVVNLCFLVKNWNADTPAQVEVNSQPEPAGPACRQGIVRDANGRPALVVWLQRQGTEPLTLTLRGAKPELAANPQSLNWAALPQADTNTFEVTMAATPLPGAGIQYSFECVEGDGHSSGWQSVPVYTDSDLSPETRVAYRVKARDTYFVETAWSPIEAVTTPAVPKPVVWRFNEGAGATVKDNAGKHEGTIRGPAAWVDGPTGRALHLDGKTRVEISGAEDLRANQTFTWCAWIRTSEGGPILARAGAGREWAHGGKVLFVSEGRLQFDAGWVGATRAQRRVADGRWHHVAVTVAGLSAGDNVTCYVDGRPAGKGRLDVGQFDETGLPVRIGFCNDNFPAGSPGFVGDVAEIAWYAYALSPAEVEKNFRAAGRSATAGKTP